MSDAIAITEASMRNGMNILDIISHNLANADTAGYKREIAVSRPFNSVFLDASSKSNTNISENTTSVTDFSVGIPRHTGNPLDLTIEGDGFFTLESPLGTVYTRQGAFSLDASGHVVNSAGYKLMGEAGPIRLTSEQPRIDNEGMIWQGDELAGHIKIAEFAKTTSLQKIGSGIFRAGSSSSLVATDITSGVRQGFVETSNVNGMHEMVNLISTMRQLEGSQKVIQGYNDMMDLAIETIADI
ncbi:MAG: flagellar hook-basal body protein [Pseudomonadales bacterium]|nr:flagellar hook-basal body protein [Pseudomonadales bacterium]